MMIARRTYDEIDMVIIVWNNQVMYCSIGANLVVG